MRWEAHKDGWPMAAFSQFITARPHKWHVQRDGSGPKVLLIHGAGGSTHSWRHIFPALARDFDVLAVDLPGQGFSTLGNKSRCGLGHMSQDLWHMLDSIDFVPSAIIGHSAGAAIMLRMALDQEALEPARLLAINGALGNFRGIAGFLFPAMAKLLALNAVVLPHLGHLMHEEDAALCLEHLIPAL